MRRRSLELVDSASPTGAPVDARDDTESRAARETVSDWSVLMARAQDGDGRAYARLLTDITPYLRRLAAARLDNPSEVEDAVQDVLLTIHRLRRTYDPARPFGPWLVTIARRRVIDRFRRGARRRARETALTPAHETSAAESTNHREESADHFVLRKAIDSLPPSQREAIRLLKLEEMSLKEASTASGMSIGALKIATHRALKSLKLMFAGRAD